jgi:hypothetical protein
MTPKIGISRYQTGKIKETDLINKILSPICTLSLTPKNAGWVMYFNYHVIFHMERSLWWDEKNIFSCDISFK